MKLSSVAFVMAAACFGMGLACVEIGVKEIRREQADESWSRVADKEPSKKAE